MKSKTSAPLYSEIISSFCKAIDDARLDYAWNYDQVNKMDKLTQDYLHMLELDDLDYRKRAKVATQISKCRQLRRAHKDTVEILEPLIFFFGTEKGKQLVNLSKEILGQMRKLEDRMENRIYFPRVLEQKEKEDLTK